MDVSEVLDDHYYLKQAQFPKGIYSHEAAYMFHGLSTFTPFSFYMTFPAGTVIDYEKKEELKVFYLEEPYYSCGIETLRSWVGYPIQVTDLERTMIDLLRSNHTLDFIFNEVVSNYLWTDEKNLERLKAYAKLFGLEDVVQEKVITPFSKNEY